MSKVSKKCKQVFKASLSPEKDLGVPLKIFLVNWSVRIIKATHPSKVLDQLLGYPKRSSLTRSPKLFFLNLSLYRTGFRFSLS